MNASARACEEPGLDPVYTLRDDLARSFNPANAHERMLVTAIAQAWHSLQDAYHLKRRIFEKTDPLELFSSDLERFKSINRHVTECERIWRRAMDELGRTQRRRQRESLASPNARRDRPAPPAPIVPIAAAAPETSAARQPTFHVAPHSSPPIAPDNSEHATTLAIIKAELIPPNA